VIVPGAALAAGFALAVVLAARSAAPTAPLAAPEVLPPWPPSTVMTMRSPARNAASPATRGSTLSS
jgi:enoyl-CoA hydratase/carnithine racemase